MNTALIYPPALLRKLGHYTQYHLALPHLCHQIRYQDFYLSKSKEDDWVILDNGAAEEVTFGARHLLTIADMIQADEVVVPDTLFEAEDTIGQALAFGRQAIPEYDSTGKSVRYMAVLQGRSWTEFTKCLRAYAEMAPLSYITTIGVPRLMSMVCEDITARARLLQLALDEGYHSKLEFHCLGSTRDLQEVIELSHWPNARGIDTSVPISMALQGLMIDESDYVPRMEGFFEESKIPDEELMHYNIQTYLRWADYVYERPSD